MKNRKAVKITEASITVWFSLILAVMVTLISASIVSVKVSAGRMQAANAADQAMYSLFAKYDRRLEEKYDLFFINAAGNGSGPDAAAVIKEIEDAAEYLLVPNKKRPVVGGKNLLNLKLQECALTGYTLATDANGAVFAAQAVDAVEDTAVIQSISLIRNKVKEGDAVIAAGNELLEQSKRVSFEGIEAKSGEAIAKREEAEAEGEIQAPAKVEVPADFVNPLPILRRLKWKSVLSLVVPESKGISGKKINKKDLLSGRNQARGVGMIDASGGAMSGAGSIAFKAYIASHYTTYCEPSDASAAAYQMEYILFGKKSDKDNLKAVINRLMVIREATNIACLYTDVTMSAKLSETALFIGTLLWIPEAEPLIKLLLAGGWSYAESLVDVRALLEGKRVPYVKNSTSWQTSLEALVIYGSNLGAMTKDAPGGMNYREYLTTLLLMASSKDLVRRSMDMTESEIRGSGDPDFRLDACMAAVSADLIVKSENRVTFTVEKTMNYREF